jgi:hypothetical protein
MNSVFSVGLQPYVSQSIISVLCCSISLVCGIIASVELFLAIQNMMETELISSKEFYILSCDIFKTLSVEREYRRINGQTYLDNTHTKYCNLIEQCNLLDTKERIQDLISNSGINNRITNLEIPYQHIPPLIMNIPESPINDTTNIHVELQDVYEDTKEEV